MKNILLLVPFLVLLADESGQAFPPAPYYTLRGLVRDQTGQVVRADDASVVLLKGTDEAGRTPVGPLLESDQNYALAVRIDHARPSTTLYNAGAVISQGPFSLLVEMGGQRYYPIEVKGNLAAGKGGESVRLDLTLGGDSDNDGLPDAWEQWQLYQSGRFPDEEGLWALNLIDKTGDFDADGQSNFNEYLAGTFAGDASERFEIAIKEKSAGSVRFELFAITGKTYTLERSTDLKTWQKVPFSAGAAVPAPGSAVAEGGMAFTATAVGIIPAVCVPGADAGRELYRLTVR